MSAIGGGLRAAAKRTAFHDRSNIAKNVPLGNNGSVLDTKGYEVKKPDIAASLLARRSVPALSQLLAEQTQPMNIQRVAAKRTNAVFKDPEYEQSAEGLTSFDLKNFPAILDGKLMKQGDALAVTTNSKTSSAGEFMAGGVAGSGGANTPDSEQSREAEQKAHVHGSYLTTIDALKNASESTSGAAAAADYELWEFEEDEGYTTSYSFRSRDNTTGFITTVLYPKFSEEVRKEIESAAEVVAATTNEAEAEEEAWDITMVAEYSEEIFQHLREVEVCSSLDHSHLTHSHLHPIFISYNRLLTCHFCTARLHASLELHEPPRRDSVVNALCPLGLDCSSPRPFRTPSRDPLPFGQLHRPLPSGKDCLFGKASVGWYHSSLLRCQV